MGRGFSLIEVMVALFIIAISITAVTRMYVASLDASAYSDSLTLATILCQTKLHSLELSPYDTPDLSCSWHKDPLNPVMSDKKAFLRFWSVKGVGSRKEVRVYVAWDSKGRGLTHNFSSLNSLIDSRCAEISMNTYLSK